MIYKEDCLNNLDIEKARELLNKEVIGYSKVSVPYFLKSINGMLDIIDDLQKENEMLKKQIIKPIIQEKIVYRKR